MFFRSTARSIKNFKVNPLIKILIASDFIFWSAANLLAPFFPLFIFQEIHGATYLTVGLAAALYLFTKSLFEIPAAAMIDKTKSEFDDFFSTFMGSLIMAIVFFLYVYVDSASQLFALQVMLGISAAFAAPGWYGLFSRHLDRNKEIYEWSLYDILIGAGMALTAIAGALIVERWGFDVIFLGAGILSLLGVFTLLPVYKNIRR